MGKLIQDLWILQKQGVVLFERVFDQRMDAQLFGSFISALNMFAMNLDKDGLSNFELSNKRFIIAEKNGLLFITNCSLKTKVKDTQVELQKIVKKFFDLYSKEQVDNWDGNTTMFDDFSNKIEDSLENVVGNFSKAFW